MKIFSAKQLRQADVLTLEKQGISSVDLMERAATLIFNEIHASLQGAKTPVKIFSGIGNNGGDGLVIGRLLLEHGYDVTIYGVNYSDNRSQEFLTNYDRYKNITKDWPVLLSSEEDFPELRPQDLVIDAIFGVGLNRPLVEWTANLIRYINNSGAFIISIDMPSGMFADEPTVDTSAIVRANHTYTLQSPKMAFFLPETGSFTGNLQTIDIGLDPEYLFTTKPLAQLIGRPAARAMYRQRDKFSHKGSYGHALLVGGSYGKIGSICLSATACMRSGAGLATVFAPKCGYQILQTALPEAMLITDKTEDYLTEIEFDLEPSVICFGVGVGKEEKTLEAFEALLDRTQMPMVIDADGLNFLAGKKELLKKVPKSSVLTPHPKELERLIGSWKDDFEKLEKAGRFVRQYRLILVIKGAHSITVSEEEIFINNSGNPGMATAGSGDVLAGVITGLISQGYSPLNAAVFGVYLHGRAGDLAARDMGYESLLAGDIAAYLGDAFLDLLQSGKKKR